MMFTVASLMPNDSIAFLGWWGRGTNGPGITNIGWNAPASGNFGMAAGDNGAFSGPRDLYFDETTGYIYVADAYNDRVQKFSAPGVYDSKWGAIGTGDNQFNDPFGIAVDSANNTVYVGDYNGNRVIKSDTNGAMIEWYGRGSNTGTGVFSNGTFMLGSGYVGGFTGNSGAAINQPRGLALDANKDLYICDRNNHRVLKYSSTGNFIGWWGRGNLTSGWHHADSAETAAGAANGDWNFDTPIGVAVYGSNVYVSCYNQHRVVRFGTNTNTAFHGFFGRGPVVGWNPGGFNYTSTAGMNNGEFNGALKVTVDSRGNVYVSDVNNYRVQKFTPDGIFLAAFGTYGRGDGQFLYPTAITVTSNEEVYISDNQNHRVMAWKCDTAPLVTVSQSGFATNAGPVVITLDVNETNGYWSTNGSVFYAFTDSTNVSFSVTTRLYYYGQDGSNNSGTNMQLYSIGALAASNTITGAVYTTVSEAVSNAVSGQTVVVFEGVYNESLYFFNMTNISLISYPWLTNGNSGAAVFDGTGLGFDPLVTAGSNRAAVTFSNAVSNSVLGFSIRNYSNGIYFCDSNPLSLRCSYNIIAANRIYSNGNFAATSGHGISLGNSWVVSNNFVSNELFGNARFGVWNGNADWNRYMENSIHHNYRGIDCDGSATYTLIASNLIYSNYSHGVYFNSDNADFNTVISNYIYANDDGIRYVDGDSSAIMSNIICSNRGDGIEMNNQADIWKLWDNDIFGNTSYGINLYGNGDFATVLSNRIWDNGNGLRLWDTDSNMISYNEIVSNRATGLYLDPGAGNPATNNYAVNNIISYNYNNNIAISGDGADNNYFISNFISRPTAPTAANPNNISFGSGPDGNWFISNIICSNAGRPAINCWSGYPAGSWVSDTSNSTNNVFMYNSIFSNSYAITFDHDNYRSFSLISNRIFYNNTGINNSQSDYLYIFGNDICSNFGTGIYIAPPTTGPTSNVVSNSIVGNNIFSNGTYDIRLNSENADTNFISNNFIHSTRYGIYLENGPDAVEIVRNTISNCFVNGIYSSGVYDNNAGAGIVHNNFTGNLTNARLWSSAWEGTNVQSNYWGVIAIDSISNKFADTNAATNFYAPYRLGWIGVDQADIDPPPSPTGLIKATLGSTNYITWNAAAGAAGYHIWRAVTVNEWTNFSAPYAAVTGLNFLDTNAGASYYYYVTAYDGALPYSNESWFSAPETTANTPPVLTNQQVLRLQGVTNSSFAFSVVYYDFENDGPSNGVSLVLSNGATGIAATNSMLLASGAFNTGAIYTNSVVIASAGDYVCYMYAAGSNSSPVPSESVRVAAPHVTTGIVASNMTTGLFYDTVQTAVDSASDGETVTVFAGTYGEQVYVTNKTGVVIAGYPWLTNADNTQVVFDGSGIGAPLSSAFTLSSVSGVVIRGITARLYTNGITFRDNASNCIIEANNLYSNGYGMPGSYHGGILVMSNSAYSNAFLSNYVWRNNGGIINSNSSSNVFYANTVAGNTGNGIGSPTYQGSWRLFNEFVNNVIVSNGGNGISLAAYYHNTTIVSNVIASNNGRGIYCDGFRDSIIASNIVLRNNGGGGGIFQGGAVNWTNTVAFNSFISNSTYGFGLFSTKITHSWIVSNTVSGNSTYGLWITNGSNVFVANNTVDGSPYGIYVNDTTNNQITRNTVTNCSATGIYFGGMGMVSGPNWVGGYIAYNNIFSNTTNVRVADAVNIANIALSNYWGAIDVPSIAPKMAESLAQATNFYAPYRLGMIGVDQADIDPLSPPVITNVTTNAATNILVQWQAVGGAAGYRIYRSSDAESWTNFNSAYAGLGTVTSYTDTNVIVGTRYYYYLTSIDNAVPLSNESWFSEPSNARFMPSYYAEFTNPAPDSALFPAVYSFAGNYGPLTGTAVYFSANGTVFGMPSTNSGVWSTNVDVTPYVGMTNRFYAVASNIATGLAETNIQTNFIAPLIASNMSNGTRYISVAQAVNDASNGQAVAVFAGTARENISIAGKTDFTLIGWPWVTNADNTGARIDGMNLSGYNNMGIEITNSTGVRIEGLTVCNFTNGIFMSRDISNCIIINNDINNNGNVDTTNYWRGGLVFFTNTTVSNFIISNTMWSNRLGIVFLGGPKNTFIGNRIYWNKTHGAGYPDWNRPMSDSYFEGNVFCSNASAGFNGWGAQYRCVFVSNKFFSNGGVGITIPSWDNNTFSMNEILSNAGNGVELSWGTGSNMFVYNVIDYNNSGVYFSGDYGTSDISNYFLSNSISYNRNNGVDIRHADWNFIRYNDIASNASRGIYIQAITNGITFSNEIFGNNIHGNTNEGVYLVYDKVVATSIMSNVISGNLHGIRIHEGDSNIIFGNVVCSNRQEGIYFLPSSNNVSYNTIESNIIFGHTGGANGRGILISGDRADTNTIVSNVIFGNRIGIHISEAEGQTVMLNTITNNSQYGLYSDGTYDGNRGAGLVAFNNFTGNPKIMRVNSGWYSTNIRSNYFGTINAGAISNSIENCAGTNFYAPYLLRPVDIYSADITPPATRPAVTNVSTGLNGKVGVLWTDTGASGYRVYRSEHIDVWTNMYACVADVTAAGYTDIMVLPGTNYYYYVTAYDAASNETWFSDASGFAGNINPGFWLTMTNTIPLTWINTSNYTYRGMYGLSANTMPYYSTNGIDFQMITTTNTAGGWWLSATLPFGSGSTNVTNVFYVMISNNADRLTNLVTNYFDGSAPVAALTNIADGALITNTFAFWGTVYEPESGILNVSVRISNAAGYTTNVPAVISNGSTYYAVWDSFPSSITNGAYFAYVHSGNTVGLTAETGSLRFFVSNQRASDDAESAYVFNNPYTGIGDIVFKDLPTNTVLSIYTVSGKLVRKLEMPAGDNAGMITWSVTDMNGRLASPGVYICYVSSPAGIRIMKLIIKRRKQ
ncbi:MAG: right-handed parallel beta-helix repeat-containing protein [Spirochaetes bacterium]|nr:right-handed parallel beta-helix repeat-containing protein [Spirochaetota bacterium]